MKKLDDIRLVVARAIYNEENFIFSSLQSQQKIVDIDMTYIADGSWNPANKSFHSIDGTRTITKLFTDIKWMGCGTHYKSEAEKRNRLIKWIEQDSHDEPTWVLVIDGDEELLFRDQIYHDQFLPSDKKISLKPYLQTLDADCDFVIIESFPQNEIKRHPLEYFQLRLFKAGKGIYWDDIFPMRYINSKKEILMDYSENHWLLAKKHAYNPNLVIRNKWFLRDPERLKITKEYLTKRAQQVWLKERIDAEKSGQNMFF